MDDEHEVTHPGILANLWSNLRVDADGHYLQVGLTRIPVAVEDAPFVVVRLEVQAGELRVTLSDGSRETLSPDTLELGAGDVPYGRVKGGAFAARLSRAAAWQLLQHVVPEEGTGCPVLVLGTARYPLTSSGHG
jgi:hypothetical protein